jgi:hypothetical protein
MKLFRIEAKRLLLGRRHIVGSWDEMSCMSIYFINNEYFDIDFIKGASSYFHYELNNPETTLVWSSFSRYYARKRTFKKPTIMNEFIC